ncbi:hypothetical protein GCM10010970_26460 [Silvimonas iriomotensis]|uniref:Peptidase E n=1 Tax=Silvimonas iriomotensis TaxID=449662 RepID=A0ABQ2PB68_9NEIS|nr:hypothetical protein GCM10010970_26460 [Silvimonas iriomotensis]
MPSHLSLFRNNVADIEAHLLAQDVIYVGGGNTKSMLAVWREWGVDQLLHTALQRGVVLAGTSAGAICWFEWGLTDSFHGAYRPLPGLGWLPGAACPHFSNTTERPRVFNDCIQTGQIPAGYGLDDGAMLHFVNGKVQSVLASKEGAGVYWHEQGRAPALLAGAATA